MDSRYLVDSSVWIDYLKGKNIELCSFMDELLDKGHIAINGIIFNEICLGAKDKAQYQKYSSYFQSIQIYEHSLEDFLQTSETRFRLKKKGITTFLADALIAQTALAYQLLLFTKDKDFIPWKKHFGLHLQLF